MLNYIHQKVRTQDQSDVHKIGLTTEGNSPGELELIEKTRVQVHYINDKVSSAQHMSSFSHLDLCSYFIPVVAVCKCTHAFSQHSDLQHQLNHQYGKPSVICHIQSVYTYLCNGQPTISACQG